MKRLAFDLRCLSSSGKPGAGIPHATEGLWRACQRQASSFDLECVTEPPLEAFFASTGSVPWGIRASTFPWVHDLAIFAHPEWFPESWLRRQYTTRKFLYGLRQARHVFCVSEDTKRSLQMLVPSLERVTVTSEGVACAAEVLPLCERLDQVLIFGTVEPRKNIPFILELWPEVCRMLGRSVRLVVAGQDGWGSVVVEASANVERRRNVTDEERDVLMSQSRLVLVPSLHEGFGRVALEAMACGTPVIASRVGAHPEVVWWEAEDEETSPLQDPVDREGWVKAIITLLKDEETWNKHQAMGRARAALFSWEEVARRILAVIAENC